MAKRSKTDLFVRTYFAEDSPYQKRRKSLEERDLKRTIRLSAIEGAYVRKEDSSIDSDVSRYEAF